jgi:hypothetical protein
MKTPIAEGQCIYYNFVKPHMALDGQTLAGKAGIGIKGISVGVGLSYKVFGWLLK